MLGNICRFELYAAHSGSIFYGTCRNTKFSTCKIKWKILFWEIVFDDTSQQPITVSKLAAEAQKQVVKTVKN